MIDPMDLNHHTQIPLTARGRDLLMAILRDGECCCDLPSIHKTRQLAQSQLSDFHEGIKRRINPRKYPVGLEPRLHDLKTRLIHQARGQQV